MEWTARPAALGTDYIPGVLRNLSGPGQGVGTIGHLRLIGFTAIQNKL
jgi:hypothetical protein